MRRPNFLRSARYAVPVMMFGLALACNDTMENPVGPDGPVIGAPRMLLTLGTNSDIRTDGTRDINGAEWNTLYNLNVGTGQIDPFLTISNTGSEEGFNTDAKTLPLNAERSQFTDSLPLNVVPVIIENNIGGTPTLWREFILEANESSNGLNPQFSIDRFDVYICHDPAAPYYDELSDFVVGSSNSLCSRIYTLGAFASLAATSGLTSGSGLNLDYRILIPAHLFTATANQACPYNPTPGVDCGYYIVLHAAMGGVGGDYETGSTFEEFSTIKRPVPPQLTLVKRVVNDNGGSATVTDFSITTDAGAVTFGSATADGTNTLKYTSTTLQIFAGTYTLVEADVAGYTEGTWSCVGQAGAVVSTFNAGSVVLADGEIVTCTITNNDVAPQLGLVKEVVNNDGGTAHASAWTLVATGAGGFSGAGGPATGATATNGPHAVTAGIQYTLSESGGPAGYTAASVWVCTGGGTFTTPDKITLGVGETASCKIVNNDNPPGLTLVKEVVNDNGGTAVASDFTLSRSPSTALAAGVQYTLSESGPAGYTAASAWVCTGTGGTFESPNKITLALGASVSCKIVNNDNPPSLSLVKAVVNDNGGTAIASDFTLSRSPSTALAANVQYTLSESGPAGYTAASAWVCTGTGGTFESPNKVTLALGANVSCSITNDDNPPGLTLVKEVVNDNGGTAVASDFTLSRSPSTALAAGVQYTLSESGPAGYTAASAWVCTGTGGTFESPNKITLDRGANVSCSITNNDIPPQLTLVKQVINDDQGIAIAAAWTLTATGSGGFSGSGIAIASGVTASLGPNNVTAGVQYALSESGGPSGYDAAAAWVCTGGGTFASPNLITLGLNEVATCTITNNDIPIARLEGRMTGGGNQITVGDARVSRGLTLHCDITLSNNLEINWGKNKWHLDKPILTADCADDPNITPYPPDSPFDTFNGTAVGRLNGVDGSRIEFTFVDDGEPGSDDMARIKIYAPNSNTVVLDVPLTKITRGNLQAHYDQPHK